MKKKAVSLGQMLKQPTTLPTSRKQKILLLNLGQVKSRRSLIKKKKKKVLKHDENTLRTWATFGKSLFDSISL